MKRMIGMAVLALTSVAVLSGCKKDPLTNMTDEESRIYITNHDTTANFSMYKTYSIADSVSVIDNNTLKEKSNSAWDQQVLAAVRNQMDARGYTRVPRSEHPDLGINVSRVLNTTTHLVDLNDYYNDYYGYYDPYYWGYGGYGYNFPYYATYQSTEAFLSVEILDLKNASENGSINVLWSGVVRGSGIFNSNTVNDQVKALFSQSAYIKTAQ